MNKLLLAGLVLLSACQPAPTEKPPLEGARIGGPFTLTDQNGRTVTDRSFAGKYRIMYFGYTFCPDVCPTDVQSISAGLKLAERDAPGKAAKASVSTDAIRATPARLRVPLLIAAQDST